MSVFWRSYTVGNLSAAIASRMGYSQAKINAMTQAHDVTFMIA